MTLKRMPMLVAVLFAYKIIQLAEANRRKGVKADDYSYSYSDDDYGSYQYEKPLEKPIDRRIPCYVCTFLQEEDYSQGMENCKEPFNSFSIPEVMCNGSCAMTHIWLKKPTEYTVIRDCRPKCREVVSENKYVRCCGTKLCNAFTSSSCHQNMRFIVTAFLAAVAFLTALL